MKIRFVRLLGASVAVLFLLLACGESKISTPEQEYLAIKKKLANGWNTWNTRSVLSHVLLPEGLSINLMMKDYVSSDTLKEALIGRRKPGCERIWVGDHTNDGAYTGLTLEWRGSKIKIQTATRENELVVWIEPEKPSDSVTLFVDVSILWKKPGTVSKTGNGFEAEIGNKKYPVFISASGNAPKDGFLEIPLSGEIFISSGKEREKDEVKKIITENHEAFLEIKNSFGTLSNLYEAQHNAVAWDVIYDPLNDRVITPVSRLWSTGQGGYILFVWDNLFAAYMHSLDSKELAYANAVEIIKEKKDLEFVPQFVTGKGVRGKDRSQPPVGSFVIRELYRKYQEKWLLELVFDDLYSWNQWWLKARQTDSLFCWGSNAYPHTIDHWLDTFGVGNFQGPKLESGMDNSQMYDNMPYDSITGKQELIDVGLSSFYILDCEALADIAAVLGKDSEEKILRERAKIYKTKLETLWSEEKGIYLNRRTDTKQFSERLSPTCFYPMFTGLPSRQQVDRMMNEHFYNNEEFWGDYIIPVTPRNDSAYKDNTYWRGRIWAPVNFLVYLCLREYDLKVPRADLCKKSQELILKSWETDRYIFENFNAGNGAGDDVKDSDKFYHWGALLGFISFIEQGYVPAPEEPIK